MQEYISIVSAVTALLAVIVGPIISIYVAKKQVRANTVAVFRQQWIDSLREDLSQFLSLFEIIASNRSSFEPVSDDTNKDLVACRTRIALRLNPNEGDHASLVDFLFESCSVLFRDPTTDKEFDSTVRKRQEKIVALARPILKREWQRVKSLD